MANLPDFNTLKQLRDELRLKTHLFKADMHDEWEKLEQKWDKLERDLKPVTRAAGATLDNVGEATKLLLSELRNGYERVKHSLERH